MILLVSLGRRTKKEVLMMGQSRAKSAENIYFLEGLSKERGIVQEVLELGKKYNVTDTLLISVEDICIAEWVRLKCKYGCNKYGSSWCCAPETPEPDRARAILQEYSKALLICTSSSNAQFYRDNHKKRRQQVSSWKGTLMLERHLFLSGYYKAFALAAERCALCKECAYPEPCRFPTSKRPSVESFSIDVFKTIENAGKKCEVHNDINAEYTCYSIILLE
jgi:predicted metal-binding protein